MTRTIVGTGVGLLLSGAGALTAKVVHIATEHEARISVLEDHMKGIDESLKDIKEIERGQAFDTKKILERMPRRPQ